MKFFKPEIETKAVTDHIGRSQALPSHLGSMTASMAPYKGGWTAERALKQGFERVIWAWRGINAIASKEAELPLVQRQNDRLAGPVVLTGDPLPHILNVRANHHETGPDFRNRCVAQSIMSPWGVFIEVLRDTDGRPAALELFPMGKTKPIRDRKNFLTEVVVETEGGDLRIPAQYPDGSVRVAWFRFPHPQDPWASDTPFEAAGISMELDFLARTYNKAFLENDGRPGGILGIKGHLNEDETEELQRRFRGGPSSAGHTTVLNVDDIKYQDTAMTPRDGQYAETRKVTKEDILLALGTPESVLGNASGRTFDNADTEKEVFWTETMKPVLAVWARFWDSLTEGALEDQLFLVHDTSGVPELRRAAEALETRHQLEFIRGTMSLNDYNAALGRETKDHPLWRAHFIQRGFVVPGKPEDEEWLRENGYLDQGGQIDPDMDAGNETPRNVTDSLATTEASAQSDAIEEDEWAVLKKSAVQDTNDRLVAPWR
jgi:HK97 family phage portal protein